MAQLDFPNSPNIGDSHPASNGITYTWTGTHWEVEGGVGGGGGGASIHVGPPSSLGGIAPHEEGDLWYNTDDSMLYVYFTDIGGSSQWVDASPGAGGGGGDSSSCTISDTPPAGAAHEDLWWNSSSGRMFIYYADGNSSQWVETSPPKVPTTTGYKNVLINGDLLINQRNLQVASVANGEYGQDRWKKMSAGMTQIVEDGCYTPGVAYTLSGTGITTVTANSPGSGDWDISTTHGNIPVTARKIQMERGTVATAFEVRPMALETVLCKRYYVQRTGSLPALASNQSASNFKRELIVDLSPQMRVSPTIGGISGTGFSSTPTATRGTKAVVFTGTASSSGTSTSIESWTADAEL